MSHILSFRRSETVPARLARRAPILTPEVYFRLFARAIVSPSILLAPSPKMKPTSQAIRARARHKTPRDSSERTCLSSESDAHRAL